jgi:phytanoyl-CoA hydroxylase
MYASAGDLLVHHSLTIHRANTNTSQSSRKAIGFIYYQAEVEVEVDERRYQDYKLGLADQLRTKKKI